MALRVTPTPARVRGTAVAGGLGVAAYVAAWAVAGWWSEGYSPVTESISALYAVGAPPGPARLLVAVLVVTGLLLLPFAWALHVGLPGGGRAGPVVCAAGGVATVLLATAPCSAGCPGLGASPADTLHVALGTAAYASLAGAPLLFALRLAGHDPGLAAASAVLGGLGAVGLLLRALGVAGGATGLLQRIANTTADGWYVLAAVAVHRRAGNVGGSSPHGGTSTNGSEEGTV